MSKFASHLLQVSSRCFFEPPILNWDVSLVDTSPTVNLSVSPVQIGTMGTYYTHIPSFNASYHLLDEKMWLILVKISEKSDQKLVISSWNIHKIHELHHGLWQLCCINVYPSPFHQCKVTLNIISPSMGSWHTYF